MVMKPQPWGEALDHVVRQHDGMPHLLVPSPAGRPFTQEFAHELAEEPWLAFACGRYEGIDERVLEHAATTMRVTPVSLGDYVLNGGEIAAVAIIEAVGRLVPGVVGNPESLVEESHADGHLEYPVYTKPAVWEGLSVPDVLLSGNHAAIDAWRRDQQLQRTTERRPDLLEERAPVAADLGELLTLQRACWVQEALVNRSLDIPALHEGFDDVHDWLPEHAARWTSIILRSQGRLIGAVRGRVDPDDPVVWEISRLMVAPDLQGGGYGRHLLSRVEELAPTQVSSFRLFTGARSKGNQRWYRRAGYRPVEGPRPAGTVLLGRSRGGTRG